jgi:hypothetical protein
MTITTKSDCLANACFTLILWFLPNLLGFLAIIYLLEDDAHDRRLMVFGTLVIGTLAIVHRTLRKRVQLSCNEWCISFCCCVAGGLQLVLACSALTINFWRPLHQALVLVALECIVLGSVWNMRSIIIQTPSRSWGEDEEDEVVSIRIVAESVTSASGV